jgi:hypothetical protein
MPNTVFHVYSCVVVIPTLDAKLSHPVSVLITFSNLLHFEVMPLCVGPGAVADVVVELDVVDAAAEGAPTQ